VEILYLFHNIIDDILGKIYKVLTNRQQLTDTKLYKLEYNGKRLVGIEILK